MTAVNWMPKYYKCKDRNPNDLDISISTQHTNIIGFSCTISQEKISITKYFNILKSTKTYKNKGRYSKYHGMRKKCAEIAKISGEICQKNTQHDMINQ
jgi:hypothetical protein